MNLTGSCVSRLAADVRTRTAAAVIVSLALGLVTGFLLGRRGRDEFGIVGDVFDRDVEDSDNIEVFEESP